MDWSLIWVGVFLDVHEVDWVAVAIFWMLTAHFITLAGHHWKILKKVVHHLGMTLLRSLAVNLLFSIIWKWLNKRICRLKRARVQPTAVSCGLSLKIYRPELFIWSLMAIYAIAKWLNLLRNHIEFLINGLFSVKLKPGQFVIDIIRELNSLDSAKFVAVLVIRDILVLLVDWMS